jgi:hypothetical protein
VALGLLVGLEDGDFGGIHCGGISLEEKVLAWWFDKLIVNEGLRRKKS